MPIGVQNHGVNRTAAMAFLVTGNSASAEVAIAAGARLIYEHSFAV